MQTSKIFLICLSLLASPAWAVNKCVDANGSVVFQDAPCTGKGGVIDVRPATGASNKPPLSAERPNSKSPDVEPQAPTVSQPPQSAQPSTAAKTQMEIDADRCLAWYKPLLRDPIGAYYTNASREKRVVSMDLHATNGFGGYVVKRAACEIHGGALNEAWTKEHAKRGGW